MNNIYYMSRKGTLRTGCSSAEEELLNCANELPLLPHFFRTQLPVAIEAWNEEQVKVGL
jgi:hypothetical protein